VEFEMSRCVAVALNWQHDLPEGFDPMTAKELRQSLRRGSFVLPFLAIHILAVVAVAVEFHTGAAASAAKSSGVLNPQLLIDSGPFWAVAAFICLFVFPLTGGILMGQELEAGNHELLLLTQLNRWRIVIGKWITLWGLSMLTFVSLLPYVVVRYLVGGVEWWHEVACGLTVLGGAAVLSAGAIGASSFAHIGARFGVFCLFLGSALAGSTIPLVFCSRGGDSHGLLYHITAMTAVICFSTTGLALARSRLRLALLTYEFPPSGMLLGLLVFAPFVIGIVTLMTLGYCGFIGLLGMTLVALRLDISPHAPKWQQPPPLDLPPLNLPLPMETPRL
jgi:hypothetical protein